MYGVGNGYSQENPYATYHVDGSTALSDFGHMMRDIVSAFSGPDQGPGCQNIRIASTTRKGSCRTTHRALPDARMFADIATGGPVTVSIW